MSQTGSYSGTFGGGYSFDGGSVAVSGSFSLSFTADDAGNVSGSWQYSAHGSATYTYYLEDGPHTETISQDLNGGGPLSGTLAGFSGTDTNSGILAGFSASVSADGSSVDFGGSGETSGYSVGVGGTGAGSLTAGTAEPPYEVVAFPDEAGWDAVPIGDGKQFVSPQFNVDPATGAWSLVSQPAPGSYPVDETGYVSGADHSSYLDAVSQTLTWGAIASRDLGAPQAVQDFYGNASTATTIFNIENNFVHNLFEAMDPATLVRAATFGTGAGEVEARLEAATGELQTQTNQAVQDAAVDAVTQGTIAEYVVNFWRSAKLVQSHSNEFFTLQTGSAAVTSGDHQQTMIGSVLADQFYGGSLDDVAIGWRGADLLSGGDGNDKLYGGIGEDTVSGGLGDDSLIGGQGDDSLRGGGGSDTLRGGAGNDDLRAGQDNDAVYGGQDNDFAAGALGNDFLRGALGNDTVGGGQGADTLGGGQGNDLLRGGQGHDQLTGGLGADHFLFANAGALDSDSVTDFTAADGDRIELDQAFFTQLAAGALQSTHFLASASVLGATTVGAHVLYDTGSGALYYDANGGSAGDALLIATLDGHPALSATDILIT